MGAAHLLIQTHDGVGVVVRGDLLLALYAADTRVDRNAWLFDRADELANRTKGGFLCLRVIGERAAPPDAATRAENVRRLTSGVPVSEPARVRRTLSPGP